MTMVAISNKLHSATARQLRDWRDHLNFNLRNLTTELGCRLSLKDLAREYGRLAEHGKKIVYIHKRDVDDFYFRNYARAWPGWEAKPPHLQVGVDLSGDFISPGVGEFFLPEATLYEDMCLSFNEAVGLTKSVSKRPIDKLSVKAYGLHKRSAVLSAFYFVEAYLNGVAYDFTYRNGSELSTADADCMREWDTKRGRERWVKFRDKLLHYPKIILRLQHPPLSETNCPELKLIVEEAKEIRDSLVHWSPRPDGATGRSIKTGWIMDMSLEKVTGIVDAAVALVRRLNQELGQHGQDLSWLYPRDESGIFPPETFD